MLYSFSVKFGHPIRHADAAQKSHHRPVSLAAFLGKLLSAFSEKDRAIGVGAEVSVPYQPRDRAVYGHMSDAEPPGQIDHSRLSH